MPPKKETEDKLQVRRFKDGSNNYWVGYSHLYLNESSEICFAAGERPTKEHIEKLTAYLKRSKISFKEYKGEIIK